MRYSVDVAGVAKVGSDVAGCFEDVAARVGDALTAADDAAGSLRAGASGVAGALEAVFASRRASGPGLGVRAGEIVAGVQNATIVYVAGDEQMVAQTVSMVPDVTGSGWRGFGPVAG